MPCTVLSVTSSSVPPVSAASEFAAAAARALRSSTARRSMSRQAVDASDNEAEWICSRGEGEQARDGKTRGAITDRRRREGALDEAAAAQQHRGSRRGFHFRRRRTTNIDLQVASNPTARSRRTRCRQWATHEPNRRRTAVRQCSLVDE